MAATGSLLSAMARRLEGKVAQITSGASDIDECTAKLFAQHGAKIVVADIQDELGYSVTDAIGSSNSTYVYCNVTDEEHVQNAVDKAIQTYGKLDIMFKNASIVDDKKAQIIDIHKADFERVLAVSVTRVFLGMKHAACVMVPARRGSIISTTSISSNLCDAAPHAHSSSKHAVVGLTRNLAVELGQFGIRVNCMSPFMMATPLATRLVGLSDEELEMETNNLANPKGATLKTEDVANAALFLASDEVKYISGHELQKFFYTHEL